MGVTDAKNDIKTLFLIMNTLNAIGAGLVPATAGVGLLIAYIYDQSLAHPTLIVMFILIATLMLGTTALGSYAVIFKETAMLHVYMMMTVFATVLEVGAAIYLRQHLFMDLFICCIFHPSVMLTALALAVIFSKQAS